MLSGSNVLFKFMLCDGTAVTQSFNFRPTTYPIPFTPKLITGDPVFLSGSLQTTASLVDNSTYKVQCNLEADNDWFITTSGSVTGSTLTASAQIVSGSHFTASMCAVDFNMYDAGLNPLDLQYIQLQPIYKNVGWQDSFVLRDSINIVPDATGSLVVNLVVQPYNVLWVGIVKNTKFQIIPSGSFCFASDVIVTGTGVNQIITPQNQAQFAYTALESDNRYVLKGGFIDSASYVATASWAITAISGGNELQTASLYQITSSQAVNARESLFATASITSDYSQFAEAAGFTLEANQATASLTAVSASYANSSSFALTTPLATTSSFGIQAGNADSSSYSSNNLSSSFALTSANSDTASYSQTGLSSSYAINASNAGSASFASIAITASFSSKALVADSASFSTNALTASFSLTAPSTASFTPTAISASYALSASHADTSSFSLNTLSSSYSSNTLTSSFASSSHFADTSSYSANALSASFALQATSASYALSASNTDNSATSSYSSRTLTASYALSASEADYCNNQTGSTFFSNVTITTSSNAGASLTFVATGLGGGTSTLLVNPSGLVVTSKLLVSGDVQANDFIGDGSQLTAVSWSMNADTSSYATSSISASYALKASNADTASFCASASQLVTGSTIYDPVIIWDAQNNNFVGFGKFPSKGVEFFWQSASLDTPVPIFRTVGSQSVWSGIQSFTSASGFWFGTASIAQNSTTAAFAKTASFVDIGDRIGFATVVGNGNTLAKFTGLQSDNGNYIIIRDTLNDVEINVPLVVMGDVTADNFIGNIASASYALTSSIAINIPDNTILSRPNLSNSVAIGGFSIDGITTNGAAGAALYIDQFSVVKSLANTTLGDLQNIAHSSSSFQRQLDDIHSGSAALSASYALSSSWAGNSLTASFVVTNTVSASWSSASFSSSYALQSKSASLAVIANTLQSGVTIQDATLQFNPNVHSSYQIFEHSGNEIQIWYNWNDGGSGEELIQFSTNSINIPVAPLVLGTCNSSLLYADAGGTVINVPTGLVAPITSSWANSAQTASLLRAGLYAVTASFAISASSAQSASNASRAITSSYALNSSQSLSASWSDNCNEANMSETAVVANIAATASIAITSSFAVSASWAPPVTSVSASYASYAQSASFALASHNSDTASFAITAAFAMNGGGGGSGTTLFTASTYQITSSWANKTVSASFAINSLSASYALSTSHADSASYSDYSLSSSVALTASYLDGFSPTDRNIITTVVTSSGAYANQVVARETGSFVTAYYDYTITSSAGDQRAGTVVGTWTGTTVEYFEYRTFDIGDTTPVSMSVAISGSAIQLLATVQVSQGPYQVRVFARYL